MEEMNQVAVKRRTKRGTYSEVERGSGIYLITNTINGKRYVGSAICMRDRFASHRRNLNIGNHHSQKLQRAWRKYGESAFTFESAISCSPDNLLMYEQLALDHYQTQKNGYNILPTAGSRKGFRHSAETRAKMSASAKGRIISDGQREGMRARMQGYSPSEETRRKISAASLGRKPSAETLEKMRKRVVSEETRAKISAKLMGHPVSAESSAKTAAANKGRKQSEDAKRRISEKMTLLRAEQRAQRAKSGDK